MSGASAITRGWSRSDLESALRTVGIVAGDTVYFQVCHDDLGPVQGVASDAGLCETMHAALQNVLGESGTLVVPTYTFSFCRQQIFDPDATPTLRGPWNTFTAFPEYVRRLPGAVRSADPIFSNAGIGPRARDLLHDVPRECLGDDSIHARMRRVHGKICILGIGLFEAIFRHYVESVCRVPWRFDKVFGGKIRANGVPREEEWIYNVRIASPHGNPAGERLERLARDEGVCRAASIGGSEIVAVDAEAYFQLASREFARDPWFAAKGPPGDALAIEEARTGGPAVAASLPPTASMHQVMDELWKLPRDTVSNGFDAALKGLASLAPMAIHEYRTGSRAFGFVIPEKWTCTGASVVTGDGTPVLSSADQPLRVPSYSLPFEGTVDLQRLREHLHVHPTLPNAIPFVHMGYRRDWGLCCSRRELEGIHAGQFHVAIHTSFSLGTLKVGEIIVPGAVDETIVLVAAMGKPAMANDNMSGVVVALEVARWLRTRPGLRHTFRILFVPDDLGALAFFDDHPDLVARTTVVLKLSMLGTAYPLLLTIPSGATAVGPDLIDAMGGVLGGDASVGIAETAGIDDRAAKLATLVPTCTLSRQDPGSLHGGAPYPEHHSDLDTPSILAGGSLEASYATVCRLLEAVEHAARQT